MIEKKLAILVPSWDGAQELWMPFSFCLNKYWDSRLFDMYLLTQTIEAPKELGFEKTITFYSEDRDPVARIIYALNQIEYEYIMIICDDYFAYREISNEHINNYLDFMQSNRIDYMDFEEKSGSPQMIKKNPKDLFLISTGRPCIFKKSVLLDICQNAKAHSMREFEVLGSEYVSKKNGEYNLYTCKNSNLMFTHGVLEGYWKAKSEILMKKNKVAVKYSTYKKYSLVHSVRAAIKAICFNIVLFLFPSLLKKYYKHSDNWICKY